MNIPNEYWNGGIGFTSYIRTKAPSDRFATHLSNLGLGGCHNVDNIAQRNQIDPFRRYPGMLASVIDSGSGIPALYWWLPPNNVTQADLANLSTSNTYWIQVPLGLKLNGVLSFKGFIDATSFTLEDGTGEDGDTYIVEVSGVINDPDVFNGVETTLTVADYVIYNSGVWKHIERAEFGVTFETLPGKPSAYPPESHTHTVADIADFPSLANFISTSRIISSIDELETPDTKLATVGAIKNYVINKINDIPDPEVDLSNYYTKEEVNGLVSNISAPSLYVVNSLAELAALNPTVGETAYVQSEKSIYRYDAGSPDAWNLKYRAALTSSEVKSLYEANSDTNALTDTRASKLDSLLALNSNSDVVSAIDSNLGNIYWKTPFRLATVKAASTGNIPILSGSQSIDGVVLGTGSWVLVKNQSTSSENGIYIVDSSDAWTRITNIDYEKLHVYVSNGTTNGNKFFYQQDVDGNLSSLAFVHTTPTDIANIQRVSDTLVITRINGTSYNIDLSDLGGGSGGHIIQEEGISLTQRSKLNFVGDGVTASDDSGNDATVVTINKDTGSQIKTKLFAEPDTNNFDDAAQTKLSGIEANAKDDQTGAEIKALYEAEADTNAFTDAEKAKLAALVSNYKGFYANETALNTAYPTANDGDWAILGSTDTVWVWDDDTSAWVDTSSSAPSITVINDLTTGGTTDALSAEQGKILKGLIDNIVINPVIQDASTFSVEGIKTLDLDTFDFDEGITLNADITQLTLSNGTQGKTYTVKFIQGSTGGVLNLAPAWEASTSYTQNSNLIVFEDSGFYHVYLCNTTHTSDASDYTNDLANWTLIYRVEHGNKIILSIEEGDVDFIEIFVEDSSLYRIRPIYN